MSLIWLDRFNRPNNNNILLSTSDNGRRYKAQAGNDPAIANFTKIIGNQLVSAQNNPYFGIQLNDQYADIIFDMKCVTSSAGVPYNLFWRVSDDGLDFIELQLKNTVNSLAIVVVNGVTVFNTGATLPQLNSGDVIQVRANGASIQVLWNGVVGWNLVLTFPKALTGDGFILNHISGNTVLDDILLTTYDPVIEVFNTYVSFYEIYDVNWNAIPINFIVNPGQSLPQVRFVDSSPISNIRNVPMIGDCDIINILADNGSQPGWKVSHHLYKVENGIQPLPINVDIRNSSATLFTIKRNTPGLVR